MRLTCSVLQSFPWHAILVLAGLSFFFKPLIEHLDRTSVIFLIIGGVIYTVGAVVYGTGKRVKYMHSVWHLFVLGGTIFIILSFTASWYDLFTNHAIFPLLRAIMCINIMK